MATDAIDLHLELCEQIHEILKEENRALKHQATHIPDELLDRKKQLLPELDRSLQALQTMENERKHEKPESLQKLKAAQSLTMTILLLDRENEQLLLKSLMPVKPEAPRLGNLKGLKDIYEKNQ